MLNLNSHRLILAPTDSQYHSPDIKNLVHTLANIGFIGEALRDSKTLCFDVGENYLDYISYLGCSPQLHDEQSEELLTFISIVNSPQRCFAFSGKLPAPRCPACKTPFRQIEILINDYKNSRSAIKCEQCDKPLDLFSLMWRKNGGAAKTMIQIHGIQEQLAVPTEQLLAALQNSSGQKWRYFFASTEFIPETT